MQKRRKVLRESKQAIKQEKTKTKTKTKRQNKTKQKQQQQQQANKQIQNEHLKQDSLVSGQSWTGDLLGGRDNHYTLRKPLWKQWTNHLFN